MIKHIFKILWNERKKYSGLLVEQILVFIILLVLKEISSGCSLEGVMLKLKLQYFGHLMQRADSLERP